MKTAVWTLASIPTFDSRSASLFFSRDPAHFGGAAAATATRRKQTAANQSEADPPGALPDFRFE